MKRIKNVLVASAIVVGLGASYFAYAASHVKKLSININAYTNSHTVGAAAMAQINQAGGVATKIVDETTGKLIRLELIMPGSASQTAIDKLAQTPGVSTTEVDNSTVLCQYDPSLGSLPGAQGFTVIIEETPSIAADGALGDSMQIGPGLSSENYNYQCDGAFLAGGLDHTFRGKYRVGFGTATLERYAIGGQFRQQLNATQQTRWTWSVSYRVQSGAITVATFNGRSVGGASTTIDLISLGLADSNYHTYEAQVTPTSASFFIDGVLRVGPLAAFVRTATSRPNSLRITGGTADLATSTGTLHTQDIVMFAPAP